MKKILSLFAVVSLILIMGASCEEQKIKDYCEIRPDTPECISLGADMTNPAKNYWRVDGNSIFTRADSWELASTNTPMIAGHFYYLSVSTTEIGTLLVSYVGTTSTPVDEGHFNYLEARNTLFGSLDGSGTIYVDSGGTVTSSVSAVNPSRFATGLIAQGTSSTISGLAVTSTNNTIDLLPEGSKYMRIGDAAFTNHTLNANDDLLITGELEVDGATYFDNTISVLSAATFQSNVNLGDGDQFQFGSQPDSALDWSTSQTNDSLVWGLGDDSKSIVFTEFQWRNQSFDLGNFDYPSIVMTVGDPDFDNTRWGAFGFSSTTDALAFTSRSGAFAFNNQAATTTLHVTTTASGLGGAIILEDSDGAGCTEVTAKDGVGYFKTVDCTK